MTFPTNNLPTQSKYWGREVEKKITNLESSFKSAEINNVTRDSQLSVTAGQALTAANNAASAAAEASAAAAAASAAAATANNALSGLGSLDESTSTYKINADNLTAGTINAIAINGSTITGSTLTTAAPGTQRVVLNSNSITLNNGSSDTGSIYGSTYGSTPATYIQGNACVLSSSQGNYFIGSTGVFSGSFSAENGIYTPSTIGANGVITGGSFKIGSSTGPELSIGSGNRVASSTGFLSNGPLGVTGDITYSAAVDTGTTYPLYWKSGTNLIYRLSSSERYKTDIQDAQFNYEALLQAKVRTFKNKKDAEENGLENAELTYGYIAEELEALGLTDFVVYEADENGNMRPESVNYMSMALASHEMLKVQDQKLKSLEARLEALESR